ncbi:MAG: TonB-dependent receptor [Chitinivibrionales bacterium]|nr:TonB-dependent receptor [Chitinivibrionales bacterium]
MRSRQPRYRHVLTCILALVAAAAGEGDTQQVAITGDELLFMEVPTVITASRREQLLSESPVAVYVVTAEDIKYYGATSIPDALRMVPGLDVVTLGVRNQGVAIRESFSDVYSSKLLVMVDNRTVYWDTYGVVLWELLPVGVDDIAQIEIVRGPLSSLYGPNAYSGVINIITKDAEELEGVSIGLRGGEYGTVIGSIQFGHPGERLSVRVAGEVNTTDEWRGRDENAGRIERTNGSLSYMLSEEASVALSGGRTHVNRANVLTDRLVGRVSAEGYANFVQIDAAYGKLTLAASYRQDDYELRFAARNERTGYHNRLLNVDLQHAFDLGSVATLLYGASYRMNTLLENAYTLDDITEHIGGVFADGQVRAGRKLLLSLGGRYDWHPVTGSHFSPRGGIAFMPKPGHRLQLSGGTAFRNPTFIDSYIYYAFDTTTQIDALNIDVPLRYRVVGNDNIGAQRMYAGELSYASRWLDRIDATVDVFCRSFRGRYTAIKDTSIAAVPWEIEQHFEDSLDAFGWGGEVEARARLVDWLGVRVGYSYQRHWWTHDSSWSVIKGMPEHKLNLDLRADVSGFFIGTQLLVRSETIWDYGGTFRLPPYTIVNATAGYGRRNVEVSVSAFDLFDVHYYEYPPSAGGDPPMSDELRQKISAKITCRF